MDCLRSALKCGVCLQVFKLVSTFKDLEDDPITPIVVVKHLRVNHNSQSYK